MRSISKAMLIASTAFCFNLSAYSQDISLKANNITVKEAMEQLKKTSGYSFVFSSNDVDTKQRISVSADNATLDEVVKQILSGQPGVGYEIQGKKIVIKKIQPVQKQTGKRTMVTGKVVDAKGEPVIGATIKEQGTSNGTITDFDGNFSLDVFSNSLLEVSYVGYKSQQLRADANGKLNVTLKEDTEVLDEVVVTALGIKRAEKALTYNVQQVKGDELTTVKSSNFMNALAGKAAGVQINTSASGPGGAVKVVMRGAKSISQNNNALYVIDGIPMYNPSNNLDDQGIMSTQPGSEAIADINPDDIESMSLLTGPSAAALYGYEGANGVVLITTKKGRTDKTSVTFSNNTTFSNPMMMPKFQNTYGNATNDVMSWGNPTDYRYDPINFFNTGSNITNSISLATGNDRSQSYLSASVNNASGILPNNDYNRYNFSFRNTTSFLNKKLILDTSANYIIQNDKNMVSQGQYFNPLPALYLFPRGEDFHEVTVYERYNDVTGVSDQYWPYGNQGLSLQNPYWIMNKMLRETERYRYKLAASLQYNITEWLNIQGRVSIDNVETLNTDKRYAGTDATFAGSKGRYQEVKRTDRQTYADVLANFNKMFGDFSVTANVGASLKDIRMQKSDIIGDLNHVTNFFTIENLARSGCYKVNADGLKRQTQSIFANAEIGWRSFLYLNMTARNDWDSALAFSESGDKSFLYPSVGLSSILSEVIKLPEWFSFLKARFSFTSVGNSYDPYLTRVRYEYDILSDTYKAQKAYPNLYLKPEITNSYEVGLNMRFFKGTVNLDVTYYNSDTKNQTIQAPLPSSSGYEYVNVQAGSVQNQGIEMALGYDNEWRGFRWASNVTLTWNKNKVKKLAQGVMNPVTGEPIEMPFIDKATLGSAGAPVVRLTEGGSMGDLYIHRDFKRDNNGYIYLDKGLPSMVETDYRKIGSLLPKLNMGWRNSFSYKGIRLNVLLSGRFGGLVVSNTQAFLDRYGVSEYSARLRETGVNINGTNVPAKDYLNVIASGSGQGDHYVYDATNIRLQEVSIEYTLPKKWLHNVADVTVGLIGNNLAMIYCKAPFDPELVASASSTFYTGVDYFMQPSLRNMGFSLKVQF